MDTQICTPAKANLCSVKVDTMNYLTPRQWIYWMRLWIMTEKGRVLTDGTVKSHTVVEVKTIYNDTHKHQRFSSWLCFVSVCSVVDSLTGEMVAQSFGYFWLELQKPAVTWFNCVPWQNIKSAMHAHE